MDEIEILAHRAEWPALFAEEAGRLRAILPTDLILDLHHIGSTAVPGLAAKPVIDIMALTPDLEAARARLVAPLEAAGYAFWAGDPAPDRLFFVKGLPPAAPHRTHHLHVAADPQVLKRHLAFRDLLRADAGQRRAYQALKTDLAARHRTDRDAYTEGKARFITTALS